MTARTYYRLAGTDDFVMVNEGTATMLTGQQIRGQAVAIANVRTEANADGQASTAAVCTALIAEILELIGADEPFKSGGK